MDLKLFKFGSVVPLGGELVSYSFLVSVKGS